MIQSLRAHQFTTPEVSTDLNNNLTFPNLKVQKFNAGTQMVFILFKIIIVFCSLIQSSKHDGFYLYGESTEPGCRIQLTVQGRMTQPLGDATRYFIFRKVPVCAQKCPTLPLLKSIIPNHYGERRQHQSGSRKLNTNIAHRFIGLGIETAIKACSPN